MGMQWYTTAMYYYDTESGLASINAGEEHFTFW
jgi:hypothetical protein